MFRNQNAVRRSRVYIPGRRLRQFIYFSGSVEGPSSGAFTGFVLRSQVYLENYLDACTLALGRGTYQNVEAEAFSTREQEEHCVSKFHCAVATWEALYYVEQVSTRCMRLLYGWQGRYSGLH